MPATTAARLQHTVASALGVDENRRAETVAAMLENNRRRAPGYWIQLFLAMGIATLGLVLNSTAVVIGAMLVSPLMGPILELGMGFAVGSSFLVIRASLRVSMSAAVVVAGAALMTLALPFHEVTSEIAARSAPTALDLLVAIFCALTAAYTTVRPASDTTSAAAGTAIGIALVPPLCTIGFGLGTMQSATARGAALLFTANFSAILVFAVLSFLLLGFNQVDAQRLERDFLDTGSTRTDRAAARAHGVLTRLFGSRFGLGMRVVIPAVFLAAVYVPLSHALDEVTWEVRTRDAIRRILSADVPHAVQTTLSLDGHAISLHLLMVGSMDQAATLERTLTSRIVDATRITPTISVMAVPDAQSLSAARAAALSGTADAPERVSALRASVSDALAAEWPADAAGQLAAWDLMLPLRGLPAVVVRHLGASLGGAGAAVLGKALSTRVGVPLRIDDRAMSPAVIGARSGAEAQWLDSATQVTEWVASTDGTSACITGPLGDSRAPARGRRSIADDLRARAAAAPTRIVIRDSTHWSIRAVVGPCPKQDSLTTSATAKP